ncbi:MAG: MBOAT family protein [Phycisphaerales bacterium]|nr:MBOAT family protein [Phycisphaerales bacterium]
MIFSSWSFGLFLIIVFTAYWALRTRRARHVCLLLASYLFYMSWNPWLVTLIIGSTVLDYFVGWSLVRTARPRIRKWLLSLSLVGNLGILAIFKYADFFILSFREMMTTFGLQTNLSTLSIILPVGISFYTFQTLSYTIDVYRGRLTPTRSFIDFALFVAFFPQLVAGPIVKAKDFLPQLQTLKRFDWASLESATVLFLIGLTKKVMIADQLATLVDPVFSNPSWFVTRDLWLAMFCYGGQIYCDFSGYTDMAIAVAMALGFHLRPNFASPYLATSLTNFWHRWHISLSTWLRDYLYIPLGGSRGGRWLTYRNLMIVMLLGGLWHGASWTFIVWGAIHGAALVVSKGYSARREDSPDRASPIMRYARTLVCWGSTLLVVHIAWVFFRCQPVIPPGGTEPEPTIVALERATYFVTHLFVSAEVERPVWLMDKRPMAFLLLLLACIHLYEEWVRLGRPRLSLPAPVAGLGYAVWILALVYLSPENTNPFIYFQF